MLRDFPSFVVDTVKMVAIFLICGFVLMKLSGTEPAKPGQPVPLSELVAAKLEAAQEKMTTAQAQWEATVAKACADAEIRMAECQINRMKSETFPFGFLIRVKPVQPPLPAVAPKPEATQK